MHIKAMLAGFHTTTAKLQVTKCRYILVQSVIPLVNLVNSEQRDDRLACASLAPVVESQLVLHGEGGFGRDAEIRNTLGQSQSDI